MENNYCFDQLRSIPLKELKQWCEEQIEKGNEFCSVEYVEDKFDRVIDYIKLYTEDK